MSITFPLPGNKSKVLHGAHSSAPLEIKGHFRVSGPQPVGVEGGVPNWVGAIFDANPEIQVVAFSTERGGSQYSRMPEHWNEDEAYMERMENPSDY